MKNIAQEKGMSIQLDLEKKVMLMVELRDLIPVESHDLFAQFPVMPTDDNTFFFLVVLAGKCMC